MPYEIKLSNKPLGYARNSARENEIVQVVAREFLSSEDAENFFVRMDKWPTTILQALPSGVRIWPSVVDHLVAFIRNDLTATVFVNELNQVAQVRPISPVEADAEIRQRDIADVTELRFEGLDIPEDVGLLIVFSQGWRKGLFFDFFALHDPSYRRPYNLWKLLGGCTAYLMNQALFRLTDDDWAYVISQGWFPFTSLPFGMREKVLSAGRSRTELDVILSDVSAFLKARLPAMIENWSKKTPFASHLDLLKHAFSRFADGDYVSATAIVVPRIEGLMREVHASAATNERATSSNLTQRLIEARGAELHEYSWLLPRQFLQFLRESYFAPFEPGQPAKLSRHSFGHGVVASAAFDEKACCIAFLTLDQMFWLLP